MFKLAGLIVSLMCLNGCTNFRVQDDHLDNGTLFFHVGYRFSGLVEGDKLRVRVPCCQSYIADDAFKALMLEAVRNWLGCAPESPACTEGWVGAWQMMAEPNCAVSGDVLEVIGSAVQPVEWPRVLAIECKPQTASFN